MNVSLYQKNQIFKKNKIQILRVDLNTFRDIIFATFYKTNILLRVFKDEPQKAIFHIHF